MTSQKQEWDHSFEGADCVWHKPSERVKLLGDASQAENMKFVVAYLSLSRCHKYGQSHERNMSPSNIALTPAAGETPSFCRLEHCTQPYIIEFGLPESSMISELQLDVWKALHL